MTGAEKSLMLEILKQIQRDVAVLKHGQEELKSSLIIVREDIHSLSGRVLGLEKSQVAVEQRLARIEKRFELVEA